MADNGIHIGIDIGGTKTRMACVREGLLHTFYEAPTPQDPAEAVANLIEGVQAAALPGPPAAIGIGCPGPLDQAAGRVLAPPNLPRWDDFAIVDRLQEAFAVPVLLENDANAGALGETVQGSARGLGTVLYMTISTGIGVGIVINGRIHRGAMGLAGEIWAFAPAMFEARDGACINDLCSGNGLVLQAERRIRAGTRTSIPEGDVTTRTILAAFEAGDELAVQLVATARQTLAGALCIGIQLLAPEVVVLGGGLCRDERWFVEPLRRMVAESLAIEGLRDVPLRRAALWDDAVSWGAIEMGRTYPALSRYRST